MQYAHGSFTWGSADSVGQTYTCSPGFEAQLIRVWCMGIDSGTDAASQTVNLVRSMGYAASTSNRFCVGTFSQDSPTAANCSTALMDNCVLVTTAGAATITGALDLDSISATTFDLINDNAPDQNITVFWEAWNDDVSGFTMWAGGFAAPGATGDQAFTSLTGLVSGNPDGDQLLVCFSKQAAAAVNSGAANDSGLGIGWATGAGGSGSSEQVVCWGNSDDASGTMDTDGACHSGLVIALCAAGGAATENNRAYLKSWDTDGFTLTWDAAGTNRMGYVAIKGGRWQAGETTLNTTSVSNTVTVSGLPFAPVGIEVMGRQSEEQTANVAVAHDKLSWGCASSTSSRRAMGCWDEAATANAEIDLCIEYDGVLAFPTNAGAIDAVYDVSAFTSDGFTLIVDDAPGTGDASEWIGFLAFAGASAGGGASANPTGAAGTGAAGVLTTSAAASTGVTGGAATGAVGTIAAAIAVTTAVAGVASAAAIGALVSTGSGSTAVAGVQATGAPGSPSTTAAATTGVTGVAATGIAGTAAVVIAISAQPSGVSATGAAGDPTISAAATASVTGATSAGSVGAPSAAGQTTVAPPGAGATGAAGGLTPTGTAQTGVTGVPASAAVGTLAISGYAVSTISGVNAAGQPGALTVVISTAVAPPGVAGAGAVGSPSVGGSIFANVTGVQASGAAGDLNISSAVVVSLPAVFGNGAAGVVLVSGQANVTLTGAEATALVGVLAALVAETEIPSDRIVRIAIGQRVVVIGADPRVVAIEPGARIIDVQVSTRAVQIGPSDRTIH